MALDIIDISPLITDTLTESSNSKIITLFGTRHAEPLILAAMCLTFDL